MEQNYSEIPPRKRKNKNLLHKLNKKNIFLLFILFIIISTIYRIDTNDGLIPYILKILVVILLLSVCGFVYTFKNNLKVLEVTILRWSFIIGLLTTFIGFSISTYTTELIKEQESKEKVAALLDYYQIKYDQEKTNFNNIYSVNSSLIPTIFDQFGQDKVSLNMSDSQKNTIPIEEGNTNRIIDVKEPFLSFIAQNIDYYALLSAWFQDCLKNWEPIKDKYNFKLLNQGYPEKHHNSSLPKETLEKKRVEYLITLAKVNNEINKRTRILEIEQKYLRGEMKLIEHDEEIIILLALYNELNSELLNIKTVKDYQNFQQDYEEVTSKIIHNIIEKQENGVNARIKLTVFA
jgi:hypothetical protein